jgi:alpha-L-fucosidase
MIKKILGLLLAIFIVTGLLAKNTDASGNDNKVPVDEEVIPYETVSYVQVSPEKMRWWKDAKFGLFIHWGTYAVPAGLWSKDNTFEGWLDAGKSDLYSPHPYSERLLHKTQMPRKEYKKIPELFDWSDFNAQDFIDLCFASGQRYITITTKHHDGFAIWPTKVDRWNIADATPYGRNSGRDPLRELAEACAKTKTDGSPWEIKLCIYYSHCIDWWEKDAGQFGYEPTDEPNPDPTAGEFQNYLDRKVKPQLTELLTNYGDIGMIWFDVPRILSVEQAQQLRDLVNRLSPSTIINGRLGHGLGDYVQSGDNGYVGAAAGFPWETPSSINHSFGYHATDHEHKSPEWIINKLIDVVSHGGNYLLNVGPRKDGSLSEEDINTLVEVGRWTRPNSEAIFGSKQTPFMGDKSVMPEWGTCTHKDNNLYLIVNRWPENNKIEVPLLQNRIKKISFLADPLKKSLSYTRSTDKNGNDVVIIDVPETAPDEVATVISVECEDDYLKLVPFKHAYDANKKQVYLSPANLQVYAADVRNMSLYYDREEKAIVNWRYGQGSGATIAWTFDLPEEGEHEVEIDYSLGKPHAGVPLNILIDNKKQLSFVTEDTGGYENYEKISIGTVNLDKGIQDFAFDVVKSDENKLYVMQLKGVYLTKK